MSLNQLEQVDWHMHSTQSDGELSPSALMEHASEVGLQALALTDHDSTAGLQEAALRAAQLQIAVVSGVEISSAWNNQDIHIVGLGVNQEHPGLQQFLAAQMARRESRAKAIGERLEKLGYQGIYEKAAIDAPQGIPARPHFAQVLVDEGICKDKKQAFQRFLAVAKPAYVKTNWPTVEQAVACIAEAGGVAVLAHPGRYKLTRTKLERLVAAFKAAGGQALEVSVATHSPEVIQQLADSSVKYELYASQGSDYHGPSMAWVKLGRIPPLPSRCRPVSELLQPLNELTGSTQ